jgi:Domain of unknown function (DUF1707)
MAGPGDEIAMAGPADEVAAGAGGRVHLEASHADREQVIDVLKTAFVQGRLAKAEFDLRVGQVLASRTYADLNALTADIPAGLLTARSPDPAREPATVPAPKAVRAAVGLMCVGAVLTLAVSVTVLVTLGGVRSAAAGDLAAGQWPTAMLTQVGFWLASAPIGAGVGLWLAWADGRGYHWARPAFAAFFVVLTTVVFFGLGQGLGEDALPSTGPDVVAATMLWLVGLAAMVLVFSETASPYYRRQAAARVAAPGRNRTVAGQPGSKCLLVPEDWTDPDGYDLAQPVFESAGR